MPSTRRSWARLSAMWPPDTRHSRTRRRGSSRSCGKAGAGPGDPSPCRPTRPSPKRTPGRWSGGSSPAVYNFRSRQTFAGAPKMNSGRREILRGSAVLGLAMAAGLLRPGSAWAQQGAWNKAAFDTKTLNDAVKALGGSSPAESGLITIKSPDIAENGAVVPFEIESKLPKTENVAILVEKNPNILAANFSIPEGTQPWVNTRVKMGQTSNVIALVKADGKFYYASKEVKVTLGGCGG